MNTAAQGSQGPPGPGAGPWVVSGITGTPNDIPSFDAGGAAAELPTGALGRSLLSLASGPIPASNLGTGPTGATKWLRGDSVWSAITVADVSGLGSAATHAASDFANSGAWTATGITGTASRIAGFNGGGAAAYYAIGTDLQAFNTNLQAFSGLVGAADQLPYFTGLGALALTTLSGVGRTLLAAATQGAQQTALGLGTGDTPIFTGLSITGDASIGGNLLVAGEVVEATSSIVLEGRWIYQNMSYAANVAQTVGFAANYFPTAVTTTASAFTAGVAGVSNPTITVASTAGFALGDIVVVNDSSVTAPASVNDGPYEVLALLAAPARLQLRGIGLTATVEEWTRNQLTTFLTVTGTVSVTKGNVAVQRVDTNGKYQRAAGATTPFVYANYYYVGGDDVAVVDGGTGLSLYAVGDLLTADTTTSLARVADVATGNALLSGGVGVIPAWGKVGLTTHVSGTLPAVNGGTGLALYAVGDLLTADTTTTLARVADVATGNVLLSGGVGVIPSWGKVALGTAVTGTLNLANGGTGSATIAGAQTNLKIRTTAFRVGVSPGGSTVLANGCAVPSFVGAGGSATVITPTAVYEYGAALAMNTGATSGNTFGFTPGGGSNYFIGNWNDWECVFGTDADIVTGHRIVVGWGASANSSSSTPGNNSFYVRADTSVDTHLYVCGKDTTTSFTIDTGLVLLASQTYKVRFISSPGSVTVEIYTWSAGIWTKLTLAQSVFTANLPADNQALSQECDIATLTNAARKLIFFDFILYRYSFG